MAQERPSFAINGNIANCGDCVFLERNHKVENFFCKLPAPRQNGVNVRLIQECETGPVLRRPTPQ